jgi:hypothetical protein
LIKNKIIKRKGIKIKMTDIFNMKQLPVNEMLKRMDEEKEHIVEINVKETKTKFKVWSEDLGISKDNYIEIESIDPSSATKEFMDYVLNPPLENGKLSPEGYDTYFILCSNFTQIMTIMNTIHNKLDSNGISISMDNPISNYHYSIHIISPPVRQFIIDKFEATKND